MTIHCDPCPYCELHPDMRWSNTYVLTCPRCYDGAPDGNRMGGFGWTQREALDRWNAQADAAWAVRAKPDSPR